MRILVDHSGYDLLNVGDAAMLQACLARLADRWPHAEVVVVCRSSERLEELWPPAIPLGPSIADRAPLAGRSQRTRLGLEQVFKMAAPLLSPRWGRRPSGRAGGTILAAVRDADVVVAGGGGYLTDPWWWHGSGVLSVLGLAQRLGRPTAMFGQGIGPLRHPLVRRQARWVLPRLEVLGLREPVLGPAVLGSLGTGLIPATVTGDDALEDACGPPVPVGDAGAIGLSLRYATYTGLAPATGAVVGREVAREAKDLGAPVVGLPVSRYPTGRDLDAIHACLDDASCHDVWAEDLATPDALRAAVGRCRVVVTASYHAAVFALAQGIPVVCLSRSAYYQGKFAGLAALFPRGVARVPLAAPDAGTRLREAIRWAWDLPAADRDACGSAALAQREAGRQLYRAFADQVDGATPGPRRGTAPRAVGPVGGSGGAVRVMEVELTSPLPAAPEEDPATGRRHGRARALVRLGTEPLGLVEIDLPASPAALARAVDTALGREVATRLGPLGVAAHLGPGGLCLTPDQVEALGFLAGRRRALVAAPPATVVICTRDRPGALPAALRAACAQAYPAFEVVVVDNAPRQGGVAALVAEWGGGEVPVRRVVEDRPGLSWARNAGLQAAAGDIVAYLDDDETPDTHWLAEIARGFAAAPDVVLVGGAILPRRLDTPAERLFEAWGGHFKGRGFAQEVIDPASHARQHPLFPLPAFVAGGNMAVARAAFSALGGFDVALGAGTPARAGEDTAAAAEVMLAGHTVVWRPSALAYHGHYDTLEGLEAQLFGYGVGLAAFYTRMLLRRPRSALALARLAPRALRELVGTTSLRNAGGGVQCLPPALRAARRRGMAAGPGAYLRSVRRQRRLTGTATGRTGR